MRHHDDAYRILRRHTNQGVFKRDSRRLIQRLSIQADLRVERAPREQQQTPDWKSLHTAPIACYRISSDLGQCGLLVRKAMQFDSLARLELLKASKAGLMHQMRRTESISIGGVGRW